jgi:hypothetical protein
MLTPVPSVVCVLVIETCWVSMLHPMNEDISFLKGSEKSCLFQSFSQPIKVLTSEIHLRWDMAKKDEC